jgi:putative spermidine/putrescine transport system ATP-binding protein
MHAGRLEQLDRPADIYARPKTPFVASFIGLSNQLPATVKAGRAEVLGTQLPLLEPGTPEGAGTAVVRPEAITLSAGPRRPASAATIDGVVVSVTFLGAISHVHIRLESQSDVIALLPSSEAASHAAGDRVGVAIINDPVLIVRD